MQMSFDKTLKAFFISTLVLLSVNAVPQKAQAKVFRNAYVAFELPEIWKCVLEHTEWVCRSEIEKESKEAIIILTAKETGPTDSFQAYEQHLANPQTNKAVNGSTFTSTIKIPPKKVMINDQQWLDGLHMGSEIPNYFTRYLITIKDRLAILVTFTSHKDFYTKYSQDFFNAVKSLRVVASKNLLASPDIGPIRPGSETLGGPLGGGNPLGEGYAMPNASGKSGGLTPAKLKKYGLLLLALILAAVGIYMVLNKNKK